MSLATRCAACGTVFRVVQDQLKVSEGWVRCGKCNEVFNALDGLFDLQREAPPDWTPSQRGTVELQAVGGAAAAAPREERADADLGAGHEGMRQAADFAQDTAQDTQADSRHDARQVPHDEDEAPWSSAPATDSLPPAPQAETAALDPAFLRRAERAARWQTGPARIAQLAAATGLGLLLAAQLAVHYRDAIAATWPQARWLMESLCDAADCHVEVLRRLDAWAVESSSLSSLDNTSLYRLQVVLRNRDKPTLMVPALDVTLTDNRGAVVARKVLAGKDFGEATPLQLAGGAELNLQSLLDAGDQRISGYSVEIFYP